MRKNSRPQKDSGQDATRETARAESLPKKKKSRAAANREAAEQTKSKRRHFTVEQKIRILDEADASPSPDAVRQLLRREKISSSQLAAWRRRLRPTGPLGEPEIPHGQLAKREQQREEATGQVSSSAPSSEANPLDVELLPASSRNYETRILVLCIAFLTIIGLAVTLYLLRVVLVPFTLAAFLSLVLIPIIDFQVEKLRVRRAAALVLTLSMGFIAVLAMGLLVSISVRQFANNSAEYEAQLAKIVSQAERSKPLQKIVALISEENVPRPSPVEENLLTGQGTSGFPSDNGSSIDLSLLMPKGAIKGIARTLSSGVFSVLSNGMLVMLFTAFLLTGRERSIVLRTGVFVEIESRVQKYIIIKIIMSMLTGFLVFAVLKSLDVRYSMSFGAFAFVLNFIPNLGSIISTLLPVPFILLRPDTTTTTIALAVLLPMTIQFLIGSVLEPKIMGDTLGLHPVVILMALIFWGVLWGFSGMLLAVPMTAVSKIVLERIEVTRPLAKLMEGRLEALNEL